MTQSHQSRIGIDEWGLRLAEATAARSTCLRRSVGCVLLDRHGAVVATGYNGVPKGALHCNELTGFDDVVDALKDGLVKAKPIFGHACPGAASASGTDLHLCNAVHAEQNALLQCRTVGLVQTCCVTVSPCVHCIKMLLNTGCRRIVFRDRYSDESPIDAWSKAGRIWAHRPRSNASESNQEA